jgi:two-component system LytT family response regulator
LLADDEVSARRRLLQFLAAEDGIDVVAECRNGLEACNEIVRIRPDLVLLDVQMPELNGFDVVRQVGLERMPATIFVTAYDQYAIAAIDANAIDYLLKPFDRERFTQALAKARTWIGRAAEQRQRFEALGKQLGRNYQERILVRAGETQHLLKMADIAYISAEGNYVRLHTAGASHLLRESMAGMERRLDPAHFRRIHRSHIVNLDHVAKRLSWFGGDALIMMSDGTRLTLSRNYRAAFEDFSQRTNPG